MKFWRLIQAAFAHGFLGFFDILLFAGLIEGYVVLSVKPLLFPTEELRYLHRYIKRNRSARLRRCVQRSAQVC